MPFCKTVILSLFFFGSMLSDLFSQNQNNQWRFGQNSAVDFNTMPPENPPGCALQTPEGSASVADRLTDALLFYTDGVTVWNADNQPMPNGTGLLGGTPALLSSTTAAVIIPKPFTPGIFYIVTIDEQSSNNGVRYSVVDMSLQGGLGDIVPGQKNIFLFSTTSEKLQVVPTADGCGYWLLTHDNPGATFVAFKLTQNGFQTTPVLSNVGGTHGNGAGHMKVNRQLNKLAMGNFFDASVELYDFNNATGIISNPVIWNFSDPSSLVYGIEFSPDGTKLYASNLKRIVQYDVGQATAALIEATAFDVSLGISAYEPATLQLGPDNKIYIAAGTLDAIHFPNKAGADSEFQRNIVSNVATGYGLPQWIYNLDESSAANEIVFQQTCLNDTTQLSLLQNPAGVLSISWNFGDPVSGASNTSSLVSPTHVYAQAGSYTVQAILNFTCLTDTITQTVDIVNCTTGITGIKIDGDTCSTDGIAFQVVGISNSPYFFWDFDDPGSGTQDTVTITGTSPAPFPTHTFTNPGVYDVCASFKEPGLPVSTICRTISVGLCNCYVYVPNAFTPNSDGVNDHFKPVVNCTVTNYEFSVFNRWGQLVFNASDPVTSWDGKSDALDCPSDVYVYLLTYQLADGIAKTAYGDVTLLR